METLSYLVSKTERVDGHSGPAIRRDDRAGRFNIANVEPPRLKPSDSVRITVADPNAAVRHQTNHLPQLYARVVTRLWALSRSRSVELFRIKNTIINERARPFSMDSDYFQRSP